MAVIARLCDSPWFVEHAAQANGTIEGVEMSVAAHAIRPRDYLPPQRCLDPTAWQDSGFRVGPRGRNVCLHLVPGRVLLFGPLGVLDSLTTETAVTVVRSDHG